MMYIRRANNSSRIVARPSVGFTLIELLVVIAIIAILAAILTPAVRSSMLNAQRNRARMEISSILAAAQSFYSEYGVWPVPQAHLGDDDRSYHAAGASTNAVDSQARVMKALRGMDTVANPRGITFLDVKDSSMTGRDKDDLPYTPAMSYFLDPWGNPYIIAFDLNFDGKVELNNVAGWSPPSELVGTRIAAYSLGPRTSSTWPTDESVVTSWK